jgi:hypothetical protein
MLQRSLVPDADRRIQTRRGCVDRIAPLRRSSLIAILLATLAASSACPTAAAGAQSAAAVDDPAQDGWSTEVLQEAASAELSRWRQLIESPAKLSPASLAELVTEDFRATDLRPARLRVVFQDGRVRVLRPESELSGEFAHTASDGLFTALRALVIDNHTSLRVKFKIYRIASRGNTFQTRQFLWLYGHSPHGSREVHATWRATWSQSDRSQSPRMAALVLEDYEETQTAASSGSLFTDCTGSVLGQNACLAEQFGYGMDFWCNRQLWVGTEGMQGLAVGDANGDGLDDVYVCQISPLPNRLFIQNPDGTATERGAELGVDWLEPSHSALFVDLDNDGDQDLLVSTRAALLVMENGGEGTFALRITNPAARNAYSLSAADYDNDGDLDVFACVYLARARHREILAIPVPFHDAKNGGRNVLLRNEGGWKFHDATRDSGLESEATRRSFASSWEDYDNDGDMDFYVANDYGRNNLFRNDGGRFVDVAAAAGVEDQSFGMSASWGDFNRDGWMDLYVANMFSAAGNRIVYQRQFRADDDPKLRRKFQYMARGNSLFANTGQGKFQDVSVAAAVNVGYWAWGSQFIDVNNDGYEDLVVANGFLTRQDPKDL